MVSREIMNLSISSNLIVPKTIIIGATGFIGKSFHAQYKKFYKDSLGTSYKSNELYENILILDMKNPNISKLNLRKLGYQHILILAGVTKIGFCEENKELSREINIEGTLKLARQSVEEGLFPIFTSSDAVFSGDCGNYTEDSPHSPINEYGRQKSEIESRVPEICGNNYLLLRLSKIFSLTKGDNTLLDEIAMKLTCNEYLTEAYDNISCPMLINDLIEIVLELQSKGTTGLVQVCGKESWSRYDLAVEIAKKMNLPHSKIIKEKIENIFPTTKRPKNTSMLLKRLKTISEYQQVSLDSCIQLKALQWQK